MTPKLRSMIFVVGTVLVGGVSATLYTPQPATRTMAEQRDAGIANGQPFVLECPERLTPQSRKCINTNQPGALRPKQSYARIARVAVCFLSDGGSGNCVRPLDGGVLFVEGGAEIIIPSLRRDLAGTDGGASVDDGGESEDVDDSLQFRLDECRHYSCPQYTALVDAGAKPNPFQNLFCGTLNRLAAVPAPCMIPLCIGGDGGWDDNAVVDCRGFGPYGQQDGGPRWRGCNVTPSQYTTGAACVPVECSVVAGDDLVEEWR